MPLAAVKAKTTAAMRSELLRRMAFPFGGKKKAAQKTRARLLRPAGRRRNLRNRGN
jgi:hypothetical protein